MNTCRTIATSIAMLIMCSSIAQNVTAGSYFDQASKEYVKQDKMVALRTLDVALQQFPGDPRLLKLAEALIQEEEQEQEQEQQKEEKQDQQQQDQEQEQGQEGEENEQEQEQEQQEENDQEREQQDQRNAEERNDENHEGEPRPGTIAPQDALRMLDALERSEEDVQEKVRAKLRPAVRRPIEKDW